MRFATYNIRHAQGMDFLILPRRVARAIVRTGAQVVGLQEVWSVAGVQDQTEVISRNAGMSGEFVEAHRRGSLRMGNAVLTSGVVRSHEVFELPSRKELRVCSVTEIALDGVTVRFAVTHLPLHKVTRGLAIEMLAEKLPTDLPLVLVGDFNAPPAELEPLRAVLTVPVPPPSFPSIGAFQRLDHIAFSEHWQLEELAVVRSLASDHLPLVAELSLR